MPEISLPLDHKRVAFSGKLGGVSKREAERLVKNCGGIAVRLDDEQIDLVVLGADELPIDQQQNLLTDHLRALVRRGCLEVIDETQFWERLGFAHSNEFEDCESFRGASLHACDSTDGDGTDGEIATNENAHQNIQRLYTPAMVADLLKVSVAEVRKWHRHGLIQPRKEIHRLPYFDFQEISTARRLAEMVAGGASPSKIRRNLEQLNEFLPHVQRPLAQLSIIVEGKNVFLQREHATVEPNGQIRLDFGDSSHEQDDPEITLEEEFDDTIAFTFPIDDFESRDPDLSKWSLEDLIALACDCADEDRLDEGIEVYRTALFAHGPSAEVNFQLAELLYRAGQVEASRERYYAAIELDEEFVEARANLGCVLMELGQDELAVAAFQGAIEFHADFPDVHFHLARTLDRLKQPDEAENHWREFLKRAPDNSWAAEARQRLNISAVATDVADS